MQNVQDELGPLERLTAPTPKFFRYIRNGGVILGILAGAIAKAQAEGLAVPELLLYIGNLSTAVAGFVAALVAQFGVDFKALKAKLALDSLN